jgi:hypothetical protein
LDQEGVVMIIFFVASFGNDNNTGLAPGSSLKTLGGVWRRMSPFVKDTVTIVLFDSVTFEPPPAFLLLERGAQITVLGNPTTTLYSGFCDVGTDNIHIVPTVPVGVDAFRGFSVQLTDGSTSGSVRSVRNNTTGSIIPAARFPIAPTPGDGFAIVKPGVTIDVTGQDFFGGGVVNALTPMSLNFVNVEFAADAPQSFIFEGCNVRLFGVQFTNVNPLFPNSNVMAGMTDTGYGGGDNTYGAGAGTDASFWGAFFAPPTGLDWYGWGLMAPGVLWSEDGLWDTALTVPGSRASFTGFVVADAVEFGVRSESQYSLYGGSTKQLNPYEGTSLSLIDSAGIPFLVTVDPGVGYGLSGYQTEIYSEAGSLEIDADAANSTALYLSLSEAWFGFHGGTTPIHTGTDGIAFWLDSSAFGMFAYGTDLLVPCGVSGIVSYASQIDLGGSRDITFHATDTGSAYSAISLEEGTQLSQYLSRKLVGQTDGGGAGVLVTSGSRISSIGSVFGISVNGPGIHLDGGDLRILSNNTDQATTVDATSTHAQAIFAEHCSSLSANIINANGPQGIVATSCSSVSGVKGTLVASAGATVQANTCARVALGTGPWTMNASTYCIDARSGGLVTCASTPTLAAGTAELIVGAAGAESGTFAALLPAANTSVSNIVSGQGGSTILRA